MGIVVVSDSHCLKGKLQDIVSMHADDKTLFVHCGDSQLPKSSPYLSSYHVVRGNCDYDRDLPESLILEYKGYRIFVCHGHLFDVKYSLHKLNSVARENNCEIACFGHTHELLAEKINGVMMINPGALFFPRKFLKKTYAFIEIIDGSIDVRHIEL